MRRLFALLAVLVAGYGLYAYRPLGAIYMDLRFFAQKLANLTAVEGRQYAHTAQILGEIHHKTGLTLYSKNLEILREQGMITVHINATVPVELPGLNTRLQHDITASATAEARKRPH